MHYAIEQMLRKYNCYSQTDYLNALKEIFQEIALLGLWRAKFYEKAAFYGGSALRILYGLDRFSEDLDFTLLHSDTQFDLELFNKAIKDELNSFGFEVTVTKKNKNSPSNIESAFLKADTKKQFLVIDASSSLIKHIHNMHTIKIKMEIDVKPPQKFSTEAKTLLQPIPFSIRSLTIPDLFAGKVHAILCRPWVMRVKGRDWYDFVWYIASQIPLNLTYLQERLIQSNSWETHKLLSHQDLVSLLKRKISKTDFETAKKDVLPFIKDNASIALWSKEFFEEILKRLNTQPKAE